MLPQPAPAPAPSESIIDSLPTEAPTTAAEQTGPTAAEVSDVRHGFFVKTADNSFVPLANKNPETNTSISETIVRTGSFVWFSPEDFDAIPRVKPDESDLVYFQDYQDAFLNAPLVLERLKDKGYTFGITFHQDAPVTATAPGETTTETTVASETTAADANLPLVGNIKNPLMIEFPTIFPGSSAEAFFAGQLDNDAYIFTKIDDTEFKKDSIPFYKHAFFNQLTNNTKTPDNVDTLKDSSKTGTTGVLEGLENKEYTLHGFKGTTPVAVTLKADVRCLTPVYPYLPLDTLKSYLMPEDLSERFCKVNLPDGLVEGYYILNGKMVVYLETGLSEEAAAAATVTPAP
jgi:hypothetical protein